jgi:hypothetical protein
MSAHRATWERLTASGFATAIAAATTIGYRTAMLAAVRDAAELHDPEFVRMGTEKVEAAAAAGAEMVLAGPLLPFWILEWGWSAGQHTQAALVEAMFCRSPGELAVLQQRWAGQMASANEKFAETLLGVAAAGLRPIPPAPAANARRLGRRPPRG